ncbi:hypothetical protein EG329_005247 [Mollisiaceae sp. DMI_Dod_QoI]|nr:hypothetical protein EG329_005247 [Helotiales sp. DMI_Dod_QoI]
MGAYSPALVVGDGAIGFKGTESVNQIMNTLEGRVTKAAAANGATNANLATTEGTTQAGVIQAGVTPAEAAPAEQAPTTDVASETIAQGELPQGLSKNVVPRQEDD